LLHAEIVIKGVWGAEIMIKGPVADHHAVPCC
jgi:hypothetical protein